MARKKASRKSNNQKLINEIYGIIIIMFSALLIISIYFNSGGIIGQAVKNVFKGLMGIGAYIIPIFVLMLGIEIILKQNKVKIEHKFYAMAFLYLFFIVFIEIDQSTKIIDVSFWKRIEMIYKSGIDNLGGGAIGEIICYPTIKLLGVVGTYIFSGTFMFVNILIITNASVYNISSSIKNNTKKVFGKISRPKPNSKKKDENIQDQYIDVDGEDKQKYIEDVSKKIKILDFFKSSDLNDAEENDDPMVIDVNQAKDNGKENKHDYEAEGVDLGSAKSKKQKSSSKDNQNICDEINTHAKKPINKFVFPPLELLNNQVSNKSVGDKKELISSAKVLEETLDSFGVEAKVVQVSRGPVITRYELQPNPGVKVSKIVNLSDDIALNLAASAVRIEAPIPGKAAVGIEIPNKDASPVFLREVLESKEFINSKSPLSFALGKDVAGNSIIADLSKMPHLLIAGATGSGKSVCVNSLIASILYKASPEDVRLVMIDPKVVELSTYNGIPHLLIPVVTDSRKAAGALGWAVQEMTNRYKLFADNNVRNIESYNDLMEKTTPENKLPKIIIIIDELADLMMVAPNDVEDCICRLAQMARAAGMHLVVATQRPSVDVITGVIKANIPSRISFAVSSQVDSRTILDMAGAEKLLGKGDMLYYPIGESKPIRVQGSFVSEEEEEKVLLKTRLLQIMKKR